MAAAYQLADIVVSATTKPESFGRTLVEAQAAGKMVIAPKHGASPEVVAPELATGLFKPGNTTALTQALRRLCSADSETRQQLSAAAQHFVSTRYTLRQMCDKTLAVYQHQIDQREQHG